MISLWSMKMTSNYPTSCLQVRKTKTKGKQTVFQKGALGKTSKVKHFNHSVFSCSACLRKHKIMLLFSDMPFIKHVACAKVNLYYRIKLSSSPKWSNCYFKAMIISAILCKTGRHGKKLHSRSV